MLAIAAGVEIPLVHSHSHRFNRCQNSSITGDGSHGYDNDDCRKLMVTRASYENLLRSTNTGSSHMNFMRNVVARLFHIPYTPSQQ